jgi:hypothetical protein
MYLSVAVALFTLMISAVPSLSAQSWANAPAPGNVLLAGHSHEASLGRTSLVLDSSYVDRYALYGRAGQVLTISLDSPDFDPKLRLAFLGSTRVFEDDNSGDESGARFTVRFPSDSTIVLAVMSANPRGTGRYLLRVDEAPTLDRRGTDRVGYLESGDASFRDGAVIDYYLLDGLENDMFRVSAESGDFDPVVSLFTIDHRGIAQNTRCDGGKGYVELDVELLQNGRYYVIVSGIGPGSRGAYTLKLEPRDRVEFRPTCVAHAPRAIGDVIMSHGVFLATSRDRCAGDTLCVRYPFWGNAGDRIAIDLSRASEVGAVVTLLDAEGGVVGENNDGLDGDGVRRLFVSLRLTGQHYIVIRFRSLPPRNPAIRVVRVP